MLLAAVEDVGHRKRGRRNHLKRPLHREHYTFYMCPTVRVHPPILPTLATRRTPACASSNRESGTSAPLATTVSRQCGLSAAMLPSVNAACSSNSWIASTQASEAVDHDEVVSDASKFIYRRHD